MTNKLFKLNVAAYAPILGNEIETQAHFSCN